MKNAIRLNMFRLRQFDFGKQSPTSSDRLKRGLNVFFQRPARADRDAYGDAVANLCLIHEGRALALHTLNDLSIKAIDYVMSIGRQTVWQVAEAIDVRCRLAKHLEVRVFADEVM